MKESFKIIVLLFISLFANAQETGNIEGRILSSDGVPIKGISIRQAKASYSNKTNQNGEFRFPNFPTGNHVIVIEGNGMKKQTKEVKVSPSQTTKVEFKLEEEILALNEIVIVIKGTPNKKRESVLSGINLKPMDIPQSIQIIGSATIEQQQSIRLSDVVKNVNGVYVGSARGGAQETFWSRGYDMSANNMFKNGFRINNGAMPEVASLEKVEVLKGSAALLFGNVTPGGILNMVTKKPSFNKGGEVAMQMGSYSFYKPSIDFYGPLNDVIAYRFIGSYENSESFRDVVKKERYYINPSVLFKVSDKTEIVLQGDYLHDDWTPDFGTGSIGKEIAAVPRNTYLGASWSNGKTSQATVSGIVKYSINNNWKLNFNTSFQNYDRTNEGTERIQPLLNGDWNRPLGKNKTLEQRGSEQINIQGTFLTGKVKHQLFSGIDAENIFSKNYTFTFNPITYDQINIFDLDKYIPRTDIPLVKNTKIVSTTTNRFGVYAQDLISVTEKIKILAGLRWSWQEAQAITNDLLTIKTTEGPKLLDVAFTPKIGVVYQPTKNSSLFASYANSFTPNSGLTIYNTPIEASIIDQYEVGVKNDFLKGKLSTNITLYQIVNSNLSQTAEFNLDGTINTNSNIKTLSGETTSKGIEIDINAKPIEGLCILAGYSYNDMRYTKTTGSNGSFIEGDRLARTPANTANLSFFYTMPVGLLKGFSIGSAANYIGNRVGGWNNQLVINSTTGAVSIRDREIPIDGYTTIDFSAGYNWKQFSILCKLSNIANVLNYTVHENYSVNPIAPRQLTTSIKYKF
ncbi:TonB-dependent siderophore receptor [Flavobacterium sp. K5-23]|uniref:TonB-dependent siderophore receptor n=1 Tax=Flavobacterium sp. K5-23 TaxID=2746225 RepID=UPI0020100295|nr:TonB-dependent siderophore receptor [Flavobacterium sp. K5-23]UQD56355.1 TonB-dependent receptor [Flavobacterium sp. K5-23]